MSDGPATDTTGIDTALDRYMRAIRDAGGPEGPPVATLADVAEVAEAVGPLALPIELQRVWTRLSYTDWLIDAGGLLSPRIALDSWRTGSDELFAPRHLLPVSYGSHTFLYVELGTPGGPPGGSLLLAPIAEPLLRHAPSFIWALDAVRASLELGAIHWDGHWAGGGSERDMHEKSALAPWPDHLLRDDIDPDGPLTWPPHWQRNMGTDLSKATPVGATASVREMTGLQPGSRCRIHVTVSGGAFGPDGSRTRVTDGSGEAVVWVPRPADPFRVLTSGRRVEVEVSVVDGTGAPDDGLLAELGAAGPLGGNAVPEGAGARIAALFDGSRYEFQATMVRPLPDP
ncbi:MAG TPA: hypothetical protein VFO60_01160 [Candidatus Dormibacteraeota bacterium]|nr:hypothetical protein [Candidatus Dormibacteraeota bacterium]